MVTNDTQDKGAVVKNDHTPETEQGAVPPTRTDDEIIDAAAQQVLKRFLPAFSELAK